ncbi:hypothetical protein JKY72_06515 [Candidatus Gracilibacteria bacterium]|nr:hypothetical protein [Candidatus Gracilibacteria bacterium]
MGLRGKTLLILLLVGVGTAGYFSLQGSNNELFQGKLDADLAEEATSGTPDLKPELTLTNPAADGGDLVANATISNIGDGAIVGGTPFTYTISINGEEVFANTDSYTSIAAGDAFSFSYPIPRSIYNYSNKGSVTFSVDTTSTITESDESNNFVDAEYEFEDRSR